VIIASLCKKSISCGALLPWLSTVGHPVPYSHGPNVHRLWVVVHHAAGASASSGGRGVVRCRYVWGHPLQAIR
jgi:hypothetical protein